MLERRLLKILLADDNAINQKVIDLMLQKLGYCADIVSNGLEVIEALQRQTYDVVLMDVQMPRMDGLEATRQIRLMEQSSINRGLVQDLAPLTIPVRIIAITAGAMIDDREKCITAGMDDYLSKPILLEDLKQALAQRSTNSKQLIIERQASTTDNATSTSEVLDPKALRTLRETAGTDADDFMAEMIDVYIADVPKKLKIIEQAIETQDINELGRISHSLKSSSTIFGAIFLAQLCRELETIALSGDASLEAEFMAESSAAFFTALTTEFDRVRSALIVERQKLDS